MFVQHVFKICFSWKFSLNVWKWPRKCKKKRETSSTYTKSDRRVFIDFAIDIQQKRRREKSAGCILRAKKQIMKYIYMRYRIDASITSIGFISFSLSLSLVRSSKKTVPSDESKHFHKPNIKYAFFGVAAVASAADGANKKTYHRKIVNLQIRTPRTKSAAAAAVILALSWQQNNNNGCDTWVNAGISYNDFRSRRDTTSRWGNATK